MPGYSHVQRGRLHWVILALSAAFLVGAALAMGEEPAAWLVLGSAGVVFLALAAAFAELTVRDDGDHLSIAFGPLRLFRRTLPYAEVEHAAAARSSWIDGWGIHWIPGRGWIWNVDGLDCVQVRRKGGGRLRIGSDDAQQLAQFLRERCALGG